MKLKLKSGTKLKAAPVEYRAMLRLVTLAEQRVREVSITQLAKEVRVMVPEIMQAIELLTKDKHIEVILFTPTAMTLVYRVEAETRKALIKDASAYHKHVLANANKPWPPQVQGVPLPPIDPVVRQTCMKAAKPMAAALLAKEKEHVAWQLAGCIARIGLEKVEALVKVAVGTEPTPEVGVLRPFFEQYVLKRDQKA